MSDFREIYFENQFGNGLFIKIQAFYKKENISVNCEWIELKKDNIKNSIPLQINNFKFIDFAHYLSEENCQKMFGSVDNYILFLFSKNIKTSDGNWILLFNYR